MEHLTEYGLIVTNVLLIIVTALDDNAMAKIAALTIRRAMPKPEDSNGHRGKHRAE